MDLSPLKSLTWLRQVENRFECGSTSDLAIELAADETWSVPAVVVTERQTAGRGQRANRWWSAERRLLFSLVIEPESHGIRTSQWPCLPISTAVAVCDALRPLAPAAKWGVKWPNDLYAAGRKIAGVLGEAPNHPGIAQRRAVIGVGVNINNSWASAPPELLEKGIALCDLAPQIYDLGRLLADVLSHLERRLIQLATRDAALTETWRDLCLLRGRTVRIAQPSGTTASSAIEGLCEGIDGEGALVLRGAGGFRRILSGTVEIVD